jgi:hypothetical protein
LDDILQTRKISVAIILETKQKLLGSKETKNYIQFDSGIKKEMRAKAGIIITIHKRPKFTIDNYTLWNERIIKL